MGVFYKEMYGRLARPKKTGHNNEAAIRQCSTVPELRLILGLVI